MGIVLLLLDEKFSVIHGFILVARTEEYRNYLQEGTIFHLQGFEVGRCTKVYKITDHPFVICFLPTTTIAAIEHVGAAIKHEKFMLRKHDHLQALANTNLELPDVVGQILFVQRSNLDDPTSRERLVVHFMLDSSVDVYLSLWDDAASNLCGLLASGEVMNSVMLVTTINPKIFGGSLYLNSTPATRFFFDLSIGAIKEFTESIGVEAITPFGKAETMILCGFLEFITHVIIILESIAGLYTI